MMSRCSTYDADDIMCLVMKGDLVPDRHITSEQLVMCLVGMWLYKSFVAEYDADDIMMPVWNSLSFVTFRSLFDVVGYLNFRRSWAFEIEFEILDLLHQDSTTSGRILLAFEARDHRTISYGLRPSPTSPTSGLRPSPSGKCANFD